MQYKRLLITMILALVLASCGSPAPVATESPGADTGAGLGATPTTAPASSPTPSPTETPAALEFTDGLGRTVSLEKPAQAIVSIAPSNTEILFALGAGEQVVGRDAFSDYPEAASSLPDVGGGWGELNNELIVSLQPDLVLAAQINTAEQVKTLEDLGLTVFYLANPTDLDGLYANLETVARLTGRESEAAVLVADLKARVEAVEQKIAPSSIRPLVFYELDGTEPNAPWTSGPGTFVDLLISMAGAQNLGHELEGDWVQVSVEDLIAKNPDYILLGDYVWGGIKPEDVAARPGWDAMQAVKDGKVLPFDDNLVSRPGPRMVDGLEELARLLHPEIYQ